MVIRFLIMLASMVIPLYATAETFTFTWDAPLDPDQIEETRLYRVGETLPIGVAPMPATSVAINVGTLSPGQHCFHATFANVDTESSPSNEVCINLLESPQNLMLQIQLTTVTVN